MTDQLTAVRHRMVPDHRLRQLAPMLPLPALRARLQAVGFDLQRLAADIEGCSMSVVPSVDATDNHWLVRWPDGTFWRTR